jgi:hypothetical protein
MKPLNIYDLSLTDRLGLEEEFFSQPFMMSYSGLNKLVYSPGAFYQHYILKQREDTTDKAAAEGRLIHCMLLTPERFEDEFVVLPDSFPSENPKRVMDRLRTHLKEVYPEIIDRGTLMENIEDVQNAIIDILKDENLYQTLKTDAQRIDKVLVEKNLAYLDFLLQSENKTVVEKQMVDFSLKVREEIMSKTHIRELMGHNGRDDVKIFNELEVASFDQDYTFGLRGIIDNIVIDHRFKVIRVNDLKKTSKALSSFNDSIEYYKYWMQAAIYYKIVNSIKQTTFGVDYPVEFRFIVIDPYLHIAPFKVSDVTMTKFTEMTDDALTMAQYHFINRDFSLPLEALCSDYKEFTL